MQEAIMEMEEDIVIVGGGIAGLTTALGLHRLGLRSLVLEASESLRTTGFALSLWTNAWRALDALGIGNSLREHYHSIPMYLSLSLSLMYFFFEKNVFIKITPKSLQRTSSKPGRKQPVFSKMELLRHLEANQCAALFFSLQHQTKDQLLEAAQYLMSSTKARISQGLVEFTDWRQLMSSKQSRLKHYLSLMYLKDESLLISLLLTTVVPCRFQVGSSASSVASEIESPDKNGRGYEGRCVRRKELLETLERELPRGAIRYSSKVVSIEDTGYHKLLHLADGSTLKTKVLIGCDGVNSLVAKWLGLQKPVYSGRSAIRGFVEYPDGHVFQQRPRVYFQGGVRYGYLPCGDKFFYWFCTYSSSLQHDENMKENPAKMKQFVLSKISQLPEQALAVVERTELDSISCSPLKFRLPWNLLLGNISKGNVCVAGDALHPMTPDLGQGGCSALEDGVVLARCLAEALLKKPRDETQNEEEEYARIEKGLEKFAKERRWRSFSLISAAYVVGFIQERDGKVMSFLREKFLSRFTVGIVLKMSDFHCGELNISGSN